MRMINGEKQNVIIRFHMAAAEQLINYEGNIFVSRSAEFSLLSV